MNSDPSQNNPVEPDHQLVLAEMKKKLQRYEEAMTSMATEQEDEDVIDLREYWNILVRRKGTVFISLIVLLIGTLIATAMMTPIYRATTVLQIERDSGKVLEFQNVIADEAVNAKDFYQTQYELLQSRTLAGRVIDQLGLQESNSLNPQEDKGFLASLISSIKGVFEEDETADDELPPDLETLFLDNLTVQPVKKSRLVRLHYDSPNAEESTLVINTLASGFIDMTLERRFDASTYAKGFLEERIKQVRADLEDSERELVEYNQKRGIINQDDKLGILMGKLKEMNKTLVAVEAMRIEKESTYQEMLKTTDASMSQILDSPVIQALKARKTTLQTEYQELLKVYKPAYPKMVQLRNQIDQVNSEIAQEIGSIRSAVKAKYQAKVREEIKLTESIANTRKEIISLQQRSTNFQTLKREVDTNRELYDGLLQRMKEVGVAAGVSNNNISIVDRAEVPRKKFKPKLLKNLAIALALGLFGGVLLAFLFESLDDTIKTTADLEKLIDKPVLGAIPRISSKEVSDIDDLALYAYESPTSAFAEAYRSMRTALMFSTTEGAPKVLHFTSGNAGEGKTTTAVSTAINFTQTGGNVLLIDADLRNPSLHKIFALPNNAGLTNYLSGDVKPSDIAQSTEVKHLYVISSGPIPPNPAELLSGGKMKDLISLGTKRFDYVVIDSPPVLGLADALILADISQATLMVVSANSTRNGAIEAGLKRLQHSRAHIIGTVLTKFEMNKSGYGYDYNYSYEYGTGSEAADQRSSTVRS